MYPSPNLLEKVLKGVMIKKEPKVYGTIENTFYAVRLDPSNTILKNLEFDTNHSTYFSIMTKVGVGVKGKENIKKTHIRFRIMPMNSDCPYPEIVLISPTDKLRQVGTIQGNIEASIVSTRGFRVGGKVNIPFMVPSTPVQFSAGGEGNIGSERAKSSVEKTIYEYPYWIQIANASGVGNLANWEFYQGKPMEAKGGEPTGQYNLEIVLRIRKRKQLGDLKEGIGSYCIDWNVEVNGRKLVDHKIDLNNKRWDVKINGRNLMYTANEEDRDQWKDAFDEKTKKYDVWIEEIDDDTKKDHVSKMSKEDKKLRLLRPVELVCTKVNTLPEEANSNEKNLEIIGLTEAAIGRVTENGFEFNLNDMKKGKGYQFQFQSSIYQVMKNEDEKLFLSQIA